MSILHLVANRYGFFTVQERNEVVQYVYVYQFYEGIRQKSKKPVNDYTDLHRLIFKREIKKRLSTDYTDFHRLIFKKKI